VLTLVAGMSQNFKLGAAMLAFRTHNAKL
jgi:hypothetical protein